MRCSRCSAKPTGFTLVEVVVGLAMMASVLVASLLSFSAHRRQLRAADNCIAAAAVADELLETLSNQPDGFPVGKQGPINGMPNWYWETSLVGATAPMDVPMKVIRLSIVEVANGGKLNSLVFVDIVSTDPLKELGVLIDVGAPQ